MCGLAGIISNAPLSSAESIKLSNFHNVLANRGPDDFGFMVNGCFGLAHSRLMINDMTDGGQQPFMSPKIVAIVNGEFYNYRELKDAVSDLNYQYKGGSDCEVIIPLYAKFGLECFKMIDGMFAIALIDLMSSKTILARDLFGQKPLLFIEGDKKIWFGSDINILRDLYPEKLEIHNQHVWSCLYRQSVAAPYTAFRDVFSLFPGELKIIENGQVTGSRFFYRELFEHGTLDGLDYSVMKERLIEAIDRCSAAEIPIAASLSGGIDSSVIAATLGRLNREVSYFTTGVHISRTVFDLDVQRSQEIAGELALNQEILIAESIDIFSSLANETSDLCQLMGEPIRDHALLFWNLVFKKLQGKYRILITGNGADELFFGYPGYRAMRVLDMNPFKRVFGNYDPDFCGIENLQPPIVRRRKRYCRHAVSELEKLVEDEIVRGIPFEEFFAESNLPLVEAYQPVGHASTTRILDLFSDHQHSMKIVDGLGMSRQVEVRSPFLCLDIAEIALQSKPHNWFPFPCQDSKTKFPLRRFCKSLIHTDAPLRPKFGLGRFSTKLMENSNHISQIKQQILDSNSLKHCGLNRKKVEGFLASNPGFSDLFKLLALVQFIEVYQ